MSNQRRLGRGLEALLGRSLDDAAPPTPDTAPSAASPPVDEQDISIDEQGLRWLDLGLIEPNPFQPRKQFDEVEIADLADSIREHGVLQPLVVRHLDDRYELVAGERRLRAAQAAGWQRVPVQLRDLSDRQTAEIAIVENVQRKDLNAIEKAVSFQRYLEQYGATQEELATRVHVDRSTVANLIRLLELPEEVKQQVIAGKIAQGHARALLSLTEPDQIEMARRVEREGLSVRKTEEAVQTTLLASTDEQLRVVGSDGVSRKPTAGRSAQLTSLEQELRTALGTKIDLRQTAKGKGRITIHFRDHDEFDRLRSLLTSVAPSSTGGQATGTE